MFEIKKEGRKGRIVPTPDGKLASILSNNLQYTKQGAKFMPDPNWAIVRLYSKKTGRFPWGLINKVKSIFNNLEIPYQINNPEDINYFNSEKIKQLNPKLRYYQQEAILQLILNNGGIVSMPTGAGKTFTMLEYINYMNMNTLVVVTTKALKSQWLKEINNEITDVDLYQRIIKDKQMVKNYDIILLDECFARGTYVLTEKGTKEISRLYRRYKLDNKNNPPRVLSYNINKNEYEYKPIVGAFKKRSNNLLVVKSSQRKIVCTKNHEFLTDKGWKKAVELVPYSDILLGHKNIKVTNLYTYNNDSLVYDLTVKDNHNYLITSKDTPYNGIIVHNCHHASCKSIYSIAMNSGKSIMVGCSATPYREDGEDMKLRASIGDIVYDIPKTKLIKEGYLSNAKVYYQDLDSNYYYDSEIMFKDYKEVYDEYIVYNEERNEKIKEIVNNHPNERILILVSRIEHGEILNNLIKDSYFIHGKCKNQEIEDHMRIVIGSDIFNEGKDIPDFNILIIASGGKSLIQLVQRVGRVLRPREGKEAIIYDFIDYIKYLSKHYSRRRKELERNFEVKKVK